MSISEIRKTTRAQLTATLADSVEAALKEAVSIRGRAGLVVSGGNTPRSLFQTLARRQLPWNKITITPGRTLG